MIGEEDATAIVSAILAMRGADKKKLKEALEQGTLRPPVQKLPMQGWYRHGGRLAEKVMCGMAHTIRQTMQKKC